MRLTVRVMPRASRDEVIEENGIVTVRTTAPPDKGKANRAVLKLLSKHFGGRARLLSGEKCRDKVIDIEPRVE